MYLFLIWVLISFWIIERDKTYFASKIKYSRKLLIAMSWPLSGPALLYSHIKGKYFVKSKNP